MDVRTLLFATAVMDGCCAAALALLRRVVGARQGLSWLAWSYAVSSAGLLLCVFGGAWPGAGLSGSVVFLLAPVLLNFGLRAFSGRGMRWAQAAAVVLAAYVLTDSLMAWRGLELARISAFGVAMAALFALCLPELGPRGAAEGRWGTAIFLVGMATVGALRAVGAPLRHVQPDLLARDAGHVTGLVLVMIFSAGIALGLTWMITARVRDQLGMPVVIDTLTGVLTRSALEQEALVQIALARRHKWGLAAVAIGLDDLPRLNDRYGHAAGEGVLRATAELLGRTLPARARTGRMGGGQFVALLPLVSATQAREIAEALRGAIAREAIDFETQALSMTASLGVSMLGDADDTWRALMRRADQAMYAAKGLGGNRVAGERGLDGDGSNALAVSLAAKA